MPPFAPRNQYGPLPGYDNPLDQQPNRLNHWDRPQPVIVLGLTPGTMEFNRAPGVTAFGVIRRMWRQAVNNIGGSPYSQLTMSPAPGRPVGYGGAIGITRALRYLCSSHYMAAGNDNTAFRVGHTSVPITARSLPVTVGAGTMSGRPVIRNRMTSFGSRVSPLNSRLPAAQNTDNE